MQRITQLLLSGLTVVAPSFGQSLVSVSPSAASPGTEILIEGTGLDVVTLVQFRFEDSIQSSSSGASISYVNEVATTIESAERIRVVVPDIPNSSAFPSYDFVGSIRGLTATGPTALLPFGFLEIANGDVQTVGVGTTQSTGVGRAYTGFALQDGLPFQGFPIGLPTEEITLFNASPGATAALYFGQYDPTLPAVVGDGNLAISRLRFVNFGLATVEADGTASLSASIPGAGLIGVDAAFQWFIFDAAASNQGFAVSQGLKISI